MQALKRIILASLLAFGLALPSSADWTPPHKGGGATPAGSTGDIQTNGGGGALGSITKVPIAQGGTNSTTASAARTALGVAASGANTDINSVKLNSQFGVSAYSILPSDSLINMASGATVTLPTNAGAAQAGRSYTVWNSQAAPATLADAGGAITLAGTGTYSYGNSITLKPYTVYFVYADNGASWYALPQAAVGGFTVPFASWTDVSASGGAYVAPMGGAIRFVSSAAASISLPLIGSSPVGSKVIMSFYGGGNAPIQPSGSDNITFQNAVNNSITNANGSYFEFTVTAAGLWSVTSYSSETGAGDLHPIPRTSLSNPTVYTTGNYTLLPNDFAVSMCGSGSTLTLFNPAVAGQLGPYFVSTRASTVTLANTVAYHLMSVTDSSDGGLTTRTLAANTTYMLWADSEAWKISVVPDIDFTGVNNNITGLSGLASGTATLSSGAVTVTCATCTTSSIIGITDTGSGAAATLGAISVKAKHNGSFDAQSSLVSDSSTFDWYLIKP